MILSLLPMLCIAAQPVTLNALSTEAKTAGIYKKPISERMEFFARKFIDTPYVGATLDQQPEREQCTVLLSGLDCVTFMETVLNLARTPNPTEDSLKRSVTFTRYWGGKVDGYLSRLHYTSDWFYDNDRKGTVQDLSGKLTGAAIFPKKVGFMTSHYQSYAALKANPALLPELAKMEERSNQRTKYFIPMASLKEAEKQLRTGDIIALCGGAVGIDCSHVGLIIVEDNVPHFVHASSTRKLVTFDKRLSEYLEGSKSTIGIMVARPLETKK